MTYDPAKHHPPSPRLRRTGRRSIRLKGHDYAGDGLYFVTICAHRELVAATGGKPFAGALHALIKERMRITAEKNPLMSWDEWVIMPDHFHALISMQEGSLRLGDVIGGFKAAVSREWNRAQDGADAGRDGVQNGATRASPVRRRRGDTCVASLNAARLARIWHRNYYESIVRSAEDAQRIAEYIRMNPWKCVQEFGGGLRGIGNPALWNREKLSVLCSRAVRTKNLSHIRLPEAEVYLSGWHSPQEKEILDWLLKNGRPVIACPAWGIADSAFAPGVRNALEENRMLILEMHDVSGNLAAAEARNRFVIEHADSLFTPHVTSGGMLDRLLNG